eukprot:contig_1629_g252
MVSLIREQSLFMKEDDESTVGLLGSYVDDVLNSGHDSLQALSERVLQNIDSVPRVWDNVEHGGVFIKTLRSFTLSQESYIAAARKPPLDVNFDVTVSARAVLRCLAHSRRDLCCAINRIAQVKAECVCERHIKELNKAVMYARNTKEMVLSYGPLIRDTLHMVE